MLVVTTGAILLLKEPDLELLPPSDNLVFDSSMTAFEFAASADILVINIILRSMSKY